jgi:hypothetical protein
MIAFDGIRFVANAMKRVQPAKNNTANADLKPGENRCRSVKIYDACSVRNITDLIEVAHEII